MEHNLAMGIISSQFPHYKFSPSDGWRNAAIIMATNNNEEELHIKSKLKKTIK